MAGRDPARWCLADIVLANLYGRAYGFERAMDNLGAIGGPLLALGLVTVVSVRSTSLLSVIPGLLAALAIVYAFVRRRAQPDGNLCRSTCRSARSCGASWDG